MAGGCGTRRWTLAVRSCGGGRRRLVENRVNATPVTASTRVCLGRKRVRKERVQRVGKRRRGLRKADDGKTRVIGSIRARPLQ
jgi:hypothetical protein